MVVHFGKPRRLARVHAGRRVPNREQPPFSLTRAVPFTIGVSVGFSIALIISIGFSIALIVSIGNGNALTNTIGNGNALTLSIGITIIVSFGIPIIVSIGITFNIANNISLINSVFVSVPFIFAFIFAVTDTVALAYPATLAFTFIVLVTVARLGLSIDGASAVLEPLPEPRGALPVRGSAAEAHREEGRARGRDRAPRPRLRSAGRRGGANVAKTHARRPGAVPLARHQLNDDCYYYYYYC